MKRRDIDRIGLLLIRDGKILGARTRGKVTFYLPGGKREPGESDLETLRREIREELGTGIKEDSVRPYKVFRAEADGKPKGTMLTMATLFAELAGDEHPCSEIEELGWFSYSEVGRFGKIDKLIFNDLYREGYLK